MLRRALSGLRASSAQRPKIRFQIAFLVRVALAFLYKWPCPAVWWMTGRALVCHSGMAFLFDLQFCDSIPETGTRQQDNWGVLPQEKDLWWGVQLDWCSRSLLSIPVCTWKLCCGIQLWRVVPGKGPTAQGKKPPNPTKNQNPNQINPNLKTRNNKGLT